MKHPSSRFAYIENTKLAGDESDAFLFADGEKYSSTLALASYISNQYELDSNELIASLAKVQNQELVTALIVAGNLIFEDDFFADEPSELD